MTIHPATIARAVDHELVIKKSRFLTHVAPVSSADEADAVIAAVKKRAWDARHNCSAQVTGSLGERARSSDDGEPSGTAGVPMLEVLRRRELTDVVAVVTRYFGGIKLGGGGLIRAYGSSVSEGLNAVGIVERIAHDLVEITVDYTWLGKLENELRATEHIIDQIHYLDHVKIDVWVEETAVPAFLEWMTNLTNGQALLEKTHSRYVERDIQP